MEELNKKIEETEKIEIIRNFYEKLLNESEDLDIEFDKISEEELWKLLEE